jgi:biopolymer transport protein ExbB
MLPVAAEPTMNLVDLFQQGGPLMWVILATSLIGVFVFLERLYSLQRTRILPRPFVDRIRAMVAKGQTRESQLLCEENGSSIALMIASALRAYGRGKNRGEIKEAVEEVGNREAAQLDKNVEIVGTVASVSPLLGLLGTVVGMIQVFQRFVSAYESGQATPNVFAQGIWTALLTTAYGLGVAIPMLILYKWLQGRNDRLVVEMEEDAMGIVDLLEDAGRGRPEGGDFVDDAEGAAQAAKQAASKAEPEPV